MPPSPRDPDYRPLLAAVSRPTAQGIEFQIGARTISVGGASRDLLAIAGLCDGRRPTASIAASVEGLTHDDLADLLEELASVGAVVDTTEAWRVFHRWTGVDSGLGRPIDASGLAEILAARYTQPGLDSEAVALADRRSGISDLLARRHSSELADPPRPLAFDELSALLAAMYGGDGYRGRPVPSGGGLYPLTLHVVLREPLGPLAPGTWWYDNAAGELRPVTASRGSVEQAFAGDPNTTERIARGQPVVIVSADVARGARKYASRAYRLALIEVGAVTQNAYLVATDLGVPIRALLGLDDAGAAALLALPDGTVALLAILLGQ